MSVCESQASFNDAVGVALDTYKQNQKAASMTNVSTGALTVYILLTLAIFIWAIVLAFQLKKGSERILHLLLAMIASPLYIISYYLNGL